MKWGQENTPSSTSVDVPNRRVLNWPRRTLSYLEVTEEGKLHN